LSHLIFVAGKMANTVLVYYYCSTILSYLLAHGQEGRIRTYDPQYA
jgi:hypothetical protein